VGLVSVQLYEQLSVCSDCATGWMAVCSDWATG